MSTTGTSSIFGKNPTLRKLFDNGELAFTFTSSFSGTLTEGNEVIFSGDKTVTKRTLGSQFPIGYVKVGGAQGELVSIIAIFNSDLQAKAIGSTFVAGQFVRPNGNQDTDGIPEYVACVEGDWSQTMVIQGGAANSQVVLGLLEVPMQGAGS